MEGCDNLLQSLGAVISEFEKRELCSNSIRKQRNKLARLVVKSSKMRFLINVRLLKKLSSVALVGLIILQGRRMSFNLGLQIEEPKEADLHTEQSFNQFNSVKIKPYFSRLLFAPLVMEPKLSSNNRSDKLNNSMELKNYRSRDKLQRRINPLILPLRLLLVLLRILLLPLIFLLEPLLQVLRLLLQLLRILLLLINPFFFLFLFLEALNIAMNIARIVAMILRIIFRRIFERERKDKDEEESKRIITLVEENERRPVISYEKHHKKKHKPHNAHQYSRRARRNGHHSTQKIDIEEVWASGDAIIKELHEFSILAELPIDNATARRNYAQLYSRHDLLPINVSSLNPASQEFYFNLFAKSFANIESHTRQLLHQTRQAFV